MKKYIKWYKIATVHCYIRSSITQGHWDTIPECSTEITHPPDSLRHHTKENHSKRLKTTEIFEEECLTTVPVRRLAPEVRLSLDSDQSPTDAWFSAWGLELSHRQSHDTWLLRGRTNTNTHTEQTQRWRQSRTRRRRRLRHVLHGCGAPAGCLWAWLSHAWHGWRTG